MQNCDVLSFQAGSRFTPDPSPAWAQLKGWAHKEPFVEAALLVGAACYVGGLAYTFYDALQIYWV